MNGFMDFSTLSDASFWLFGSGVLVAAELASGTFYLLMIAIGSLAASITAWLGFGVIVQIVVAAVMGGGAAIVLYSFRKRRPRPLPARANRDVNLDIGSRVDVGYWNANGSTEVSYRGANWQARYEGDGAPTPGPHVIRALDGNYLVLGK
ncbi:NfeD family protein [soil metagenome]